MIERPEETPKLPENGEVLENVQCGCCAEFGNVVASILQPKEAGEQPKYKFECDPQQSNKNGAQGCGMSITRSVKDVADRHISIDLYVGSEMESAYKIALGSPFRRR